MPQSAPAKLAMSAGDWLIPPLALALGRVGIAALVLVIISRAVAGPLPRDAATWRIFTVMAAINNVIPFTLIFWARSTSRSGSPLSSTPPARCSAC
jgi:drug/metabolite transporter (DMT)-like permease